MANMSYCRFENTLEDLKDCYENMGDPETSESEKEMEKRLIKLCDKISREYGEG